MGDFKLGSSTGGSGFSFETLHKIKTEHVSGAVTGNITSLYKVNAGKKTVMKDVEDDIDGLPDSDFTKASTRLLGEINNETDAFLPL